MSTQEITSKSLDPCSALKNCSLRSKTSSKASRKDWSPSLQTMELVVLISCEVPKRSPSLSLSQLMRRPLRPTIQETMLVPLDRNPLGLECSLGKPVFERWPPTFWTRTAFLVFPPQQWLRAILVVLNNSNSHISKLPPDVTIIWIWSWQRLLLKIRLTFRRMRSN